MDPEQTAPMTRPYITKRLLMGRKQTNQTKSTQLKILSYETVTFEL